MSAADLASLNPKRPYCRIRGKVGVSAHTKALRSALEARDGMHCWICRHEMVGSDRTIDHITPISLGGESTLENLRLAHARCNSFRSSKVHLTAEQLTEQLTARAAKMQRRAQRAVLRAKYKAMMAARAAIPETAA